MRAYVLDFKRGAYLGVYSTELHCDSYRELHAEQTLVRSIARKIILMSNYSLAMETKAVTSRVRKLHNKDWQMSPLVFRHSCVAPPRHSLQHRPS